MKFGAILQSEIRHGRFHGLTGKAAGRLRWQAFTRTSDVPNVVVEMASRLATSPIFVVGSWADAVSVFQILEYLKV
ncbi:MAG: hypothetical protein ACJ8AW_29540 [Rhodopila sp.]